MQKAFLKLFINKFICHIYCAYTIFDDMNLIHSLLFIRNEYEVQLWFSPRVIPKPPRVKWLNGAKYSQGNTHLTPYGTRYFLTNVSQRAGLDNSTTIEVINYSLLHQFTSATLFTDDIPVFCENCPSHSMFKIAPNQTFSIAIDQNNHTPNESVYAEGRAISSGHNTKMDGDYILFETNFGKEKGGVQYSHREFIRKLNPPGKAPMKSAYFILSRILLLMAVMYALFHTISSHFKTMSSNFDDFAEVNGWQNISGDVFRRPRKGMIFVLVIDAGVRFLFDGVLWMLFMFGGGSTLTAIDLFGGFLSGLFGGYNLKFMEDKRWRMYSIVSFILPSFLFLVFPIRPPWLPLSFLLHFVGCVVGIRIPQQLDPFPTHMIPQTVYKTSFVEHPMVLLSMTSSALAYAIKPLVQGLYGFDNSIFDIIALAPWIVLWLFITFLYSAVFSMVGAYARVACENQHWWLPALIDPFSSFFSIFCLIQFYSHSDGFIFSLLMSIVSSAVGFMGSKWFVYTLYGQYRRRIGGGISLNAPHYTSRE